MMPIAARLCNQKLLHGKGPPHYARIDAHFLIGKPDCVNPMRRFQTLICLLLASHLSAGCLLPANTGLSDSPRDSVISATVETQLREDPQGGLTGIIVATEAGMVTLTGTVQKAERKARAAELARQVKGVKRVKNDLEIHADVSH